MLGLIVLLATLFLPKLLGGLRWLVGRERAARRPIRIPGEVACETEIEQIVCGAVERRAAVLDRRSSRRRSRPSTSPPTPCSSPASPTPAAARRRRRSVRSTARSTASCTSISTSSLQLQNQFGATGDLAAQYIVAHEYGHHVQNVLGINGRVRQAQQSDPTAPTSTRSRSNCRPTASRVPGRATRQPTGPVRQSAGGRGGAQRRGGRR